MKSNVLNLVDLLLEKQISVSLTEDSLALKGDLSQLNPNQMQQLRDSKAELIAWLKEQQALQQVGGEIKAVDRSADIAPSSAQQHLWFIDSFEQQATQYNMPMTMNVKGNFDETVAQVVFEHLIERHETLRTNILRNESGDLVQRIHGEFEFTLKTFDLSEFDETVKKQKVAQLVDEDINKAFDLANDLMIRACFIRTAADTAVLHINIHHIATDGWSMNLLMNEFGQMYQDISAGQLPQLAPLTVQYADYVSWQAEQKLDDEQGKAYWQKQLSNLPQVHSLPTLIKRPFELDLKGANFGFALDAETTAKINGFTEANDLTLFMFLQGAFALTVAKYANNSDVVMGVPVANRRLAQLQNLVGFFIDNQVLRLECDSTLNVAEYFSKVRETHLNALEYNQVSFHELIEMLKPERSTNHTPLFQIMFNLDNSAEQSAVNTASEFSLEPVTSDSVKAKYELQLTATPGEQGIGLNFEYNQSLFDKALVEQFADGFKAIVAQLLAGNDKTLGQLEVLSAQDKLELTDTLNQTAAAFDENALMHRLIEAQAEKTPDAVAVNYESNDVTFAELNQRANQLAHHIRGLGVDEGDIVGLVFDRSIELSIAMLAIMKAGAAYLPLDPEMPQSRLAFIQQDSGMKLLITQLGYAENLPNHTPNALCVFDPVLAEQLQLLSSDNLSLNSVNATELAAYVIYTSGTTGQPKGVEVGHQALVNRINWMQRQYQLNDSDKVLQKTPYTFDVSVWEFMWPLSVGAQMVFARPDGHKDRHYLSLLIRDKKITTLHFVPSMFSNMLNSAEWHLCTSVKRVFCSGEALPAAIIKRHFKEHDAELHNLYGPTEAAIDVTAWQCHVDYQYDEVPIGKAIDNIELFVLDDNLQLVPKGTIGELYIGGVGLAKGYINNPELTAKAFIDSPFAQAQRLYKTGDLVKYLPDNNLAYVGRVDQQVKLRGLRIELGEIEHQLNQLTLVGEVAVCMKLDPSERQHLVAYFTSNSELEPNQLAAQIQSELDAHLPGYMIPSQFVRMDEMPLSRNGKIDRKALPEPNYLSLENYVAPSNELETLICQTFEKQVEVERVGINDNFFSIGGDSIVAVRVVSDINETEAQVTLKDLFKWPTPKQLAEAISQGETGQSAPILSVEPFSLISAEQAGQIDRERFEDAYPLSFLQQGMVHINDADEHSVVYRDQVNIKMRQPWQRKVFEQAVQQLVEKHEILRTVFDTVDNEQLQLILKSFSFEQREVDLRELDEQAVEARLNEMTEAERKQAFEAGLPLWRLQAYRLEDDLTTISFTCHHAILDGWSIASFLRALAASYETLLGKPRLTEVTSEPLKFNAYVANELNALNSSATKQFWTSRLGESQVPWWTGSKQAALRVSRHPLSELEGRLDTLASSMQVPINVLLLAAHMKLMALLNGTDEVASSVVSNGRLTATGGDSTLGLFLNTAPINMNTSGITWRELIEQTQHFSLAAQNHQYYPLAEIQRVVRKDFSGSLFNYLNFHVLDDMITQENRDGTKQQPYLTLDHEADTNYALTCNFRHEREFRTLVLELRIHTSVFTEKHEEHMYYTMFNILSEMVKNTDRAIDNRALLPTLDRALLMDNVSQNIDFERFDKPIHSAVERLAETQGDTIALEEGDNRLSYKVLNEKANQLAHYLRSQGVSQGTLVGVGMHRSNDLLVTLLAILKAGGAYLPVDTNYPTQYKSDMVQDAKPTIALGRSSCIDEVLSTQVEQFILIDNEEVAAQIAVQPTDNIELPDVGGNALAYVNYTSGTTGKPKGVMVEHQSVLRLGAMSHLQTASKDPAMLFASSVSFDAATLEIWGALTNGYRVVVFPQPYIDANRINEMIAEHNVSTLWLTSALFSQWAHQSNRLAHSNLEKIFVGGDVVYPSDVKAAYDQYPNITLVNGYGPTENTTFTCCYEIPRDIDLSESVPIGQSIEGTTVYVLDEHRQPVPFGAVGELYTGGVGVARGYLNKPELTEERFVADAYSQFANDDFKLYRTGDLVRYREQGVLQFIGRRDEQVKVRGFRIELGQIENCIGALEQVDAVKVLVAEFDSGDKRLVAYTCGNAASDNELVGLVRAEVEKSLPEYMHPSHYLVLEQMPLTGNGKVDKKALEKLPLNQGHEQSNAQAGNDFAELKSIWMSVLSLEANEFNPEDDFFNMGGHSLLANKLVAEVKESIGVAIEPLDVFENPTFLELGRFIDAKAADNDEVTVALRNMWCEILDLKPEEVVESSQFFDLGGHSLLANRLVADVEKALSVKLVPLDIFEAPTFAELVALVQSKATPELSQAVSLVTEQWCELLDLQANEIEETTNFFDMGGHSLLANRLVARLRDELNIAVGSQEVFEYPTFGEFCQFVESLHLLSQSHVDGLLRGAWMTLLDLQSNEIQPHTDFFEMGGHSLLANRLIAGANPMLAQKLQPVDIFEYPTYQQQLEAVRNNLPPQYTQVLQVVTMSFSDLLDLSAEELSSNPNFFDMGGHSLLANRLVAEVNKAFKLSFGGLDVFENPSFFDFINKTLIAINEKAAQETQNAADDEQLDIVI